MCSGIKVTCSELSCNYLYPRVWLVHSSATKMTNYMSYWQSYFYSVVWRLISCSSSDDSVWGRLSCFRWEKASRRTIGRVLGTTHMVPSVWCNALHDEGDSIPKVHRSGVVCSMMKETLFPMLVLKCLGLPINQLRTMVLSVHTYTSWSERWKTSLTWWRSWARRWAPHSSNHGMRLWVRPLSWKSPGTLAHYPENLPCEDRLLLHRRTQMYQRICEAVVMWHAWAPLGK